MTATTQIDSGVEEFIDATTQDARRALRVFRDTGTVSANGTANFVERIPGLEAAIAINEPGPWADNRLAQPIVATFDGDVLRAPEGYDGGAGFVLAYAELFRAHPEITSVVHVHTPWLGGFAQTHRPLPIRYAAAQRLTLSRSIPPHIDRSIGVGQFILGELQRDPNLAAVFEANGGVNVIGREGLLALAKFVVLLEEGAQYQAIGESVGGSIDFDPSNLVAQWRRSGLLEAARQHGLV